MVAAALLVAASLLATGVIAQPLSAQKVAPTRSPASLDLTRPLPVDPHLTVGRLANGLAYYIRPNPRPAKRLELQLVVRVGSIVESDGERGLAHLVEHVAFNGTRHFKGHELLAFLESVGARMGADLNAYTSFDETIYSLQVPTDSAGVVETAFQVLEDWAHQVSFDSTGVERARAVVIEEWRQGRGPEARLWERQAPVLFPGTRYAERLPIGTRENLASFRVETLRRFYRTWYRPDLMAVIAVGDLDREVILRLVDRHFAQIPVPADTLPLPTLDFSRHAETLVGVAADPEATSSTISIYHKRDVTPIRTVGDYQRSIVELLTEMMLGTRLDELTRQPDPPFLYGVAARSPLTRSQRAFVLSAVVGEEGVLPGLRGLLGETFRVGRHGFTSSEVSRAKVELLRFWQQALAATPESAGLARLCLSHFLNGIPVMGPAESHALVSGLLPGITLKEVNDIAAELLGEHDRVVLVSGPEKRELQLPTEQEVLAVFGEVAAVDLTAYEDSVSHEPLVARPPAAGRVVDERAIDEIGVLDWRLSNGARVLLMPTAFIDEIVVVAFSPGGRSLVPDEDYIPAATASNVVLEGGLAGFSAADLRKRLAGKIVAVEPYIAELTEGLAGRAATRDAQVLFELIYLYFTAPRADSSSFAALQARLKGVYRNRGARAESALGDTLQVILAQGDPRGQPWTDATFDQMDLPTSLAVYRERFADAGDFTFVFVGKFEAAGMRWLVETWIGGLPGEGRREAWRDLGRGRPEGVVRKRVPIGLEPKSEVVVVFHGPFRWSSGARTELRALAEILALDLREALREETGGTYAVKVLAAPTRYPREEYMVGLEFSCSPERREELTQRLFQQIAELRSNGPADSDLAKVKEQLRRERETNLQQGDFWLLELQASLFLGEDPTEILKEEKRIQKLSVKAIREAAQHYLNPGRYVEVVLEPESASESAVP